MFNEWAKILSEKLLENKIIESDYKDCYVYGVEVLISKSILYAVVLVVSLLTNTLVVSVIFMFSYLFLRQYTGGYHSKTAERCLVFSVFIYLMMIFLYTLNLTYIETVLLLTSAISIPVICIFSPIDTENKRLETHEKKKYKKVAALISIAYIIAVGITYVFKAPFVFYSISWSLTADAVLMIIPKIRRNC